MVSHAERRRALGLALSAALWLGAIPAGCSRQADIKDEPDSGTDLGPNAPRPDGGVPLVEDTGLDDPGLVACNERPENGACRGANDFPCDFAAWVPMLAQECQNETGCVSNGWVELELGDDGCAAAIYMDEPNEAYVSCLVATLGAYRCPCAAMSFGHFLGIGNDGCDSGPSPCMSGEFPCGKGEICLDGWCVTDASGGASG
jgi:hypothetical protein